MCSTNKHQCHDDLVLETPCSEILHDSHEGNQCHTWFGIYSCNIYNHDIYALPSSFWIMVMDWESHSLYGYSCYSHGQLTTLMVIFSKFVWKFIYPVLRKNIFPYEYELICTLEFWIYSCSSKVYGRNSTYSFPVTFGIITHNSHYFLDFCTWTISCCIVF